MSSSKDCSGLFLDSWADLRNHLLEGAGGKYFWRGVSDATWCMTTSLDRFAAENELPDRTSLKSALITNYRKFSGELGADPEAELDDADLWALGQHWGLPTTLLDWSDSPMVAAFFALSASQAYSATREQHACIYRLARSTRPAGDLSYFLPRQTPANLRMRAQSGLFTETRESGCLIDILGRLGRLDDLFAITFPLDVREQGLAELDAMKINDLSIFPDRGGVIRHVLTTALREAATNI